MIKQVVENQIDNNENDDFDLGYLYLSALNNRALVFAITVFSMLFGFLYGSFVKPVWEAEFQIVLAKKQGSSGAGDFLRSQASAFTQILGFGGIDNQIDTEVEILKSSSVLRPIYDYTKEEKRKRGIDISKLKYRKWKEENLSIDLEKNTNVLNLSYRDTEKELVIPIITKLSEAYQDYSGKKKKKGINKGIKYINNQLKLYNDRSNSALKEYQEFSIENNITPLSSNIKKDISVKNESDPNPTFFTTKQELIVSEASNKLKLNVLNLEQIKSIDNEPQKLIFISNNLLEDTKTNEKDDLLVTKLERIESKLTEFKTKFKDSDYVIKDLLIQRNAYTKALKNKMINYLEAQNIILESEVSAAKRPKEILNKYRELLRKVASNSSTLSYLQGNKQYISLEKAKEEDPWELVSNPTLLDEPVAPRKIRILAFTTIFGLILSLSISFLIDRKKGVLYLRKELEKYLPYKLIISLPLLKPQEWQSFTDLFLYQFNKDNPNESLAIIYLGDNNIPDEVNEFSELLKRNFKKNNFILTKNLLQAKSFNKQILITTTKSINLFNLSKIKSELEILGDNVQGWIYLYKY